ncbi:MAG: helical backbone metal receptor [Proteobacteria bacterium]|nr:helical backbone metal receptor [Pseudomonadota bacterium]
MSADDLIDAVGNRHASAQGPVRIVSLVPSLTELLFALDLQDQLVGRTAFCIEPAGRIEAVPVVGGTKTFELDKLMALKPTHVLVNVDETPKALADQISAAGPAVVVTHPNTPADNIALYQLFGGLFQRHDLAGDLVAALERELRRTTVWPERKVLYLIWKRPWMTVSQDTYIASMLSMFGMQTQCHDPARRYPEVAMDAALLAKTDLVLFSTEPFPFAAKHRDAFAREFQTDGRPQLRAIDGKMVSWYGSRTIEGLRYLHAFTTQLEN